MRAGPPSIIEELDKGGQVDPGGNYFCMIPNFESSASQYDWINRMIAVGTGHRSRLPTLTNLRGSNGKAHKLSKRHSPAFHRARHSRHEQSIQPGTL
jgi:hypothetical protein